MGKAITTLVLFFAATALALPICAQSNTLYLADVPFAFTMGKTELPAGHYAVQVEPGQSLITIMGSDRRRSVVLSLPGDAYPASSPQQPSLTFNRYGDQYFLSQVRTTESARTIPTQKLEKEMQKQAATGQKIVLAMR